MYHGSNSPIEDESGNIVVRPIFNVLGCMLSCNTVQSLFFIGTP